MIASHIDHPDLVMRVLGRRLHNCVTRLAPRAARKAHVVPTVGNQFPWLGSVERDDDQIGGTEVVATTPHRDEQFGSVGSEGGFCTVPSSVISTTSTPAASIDAATDPLAAPLIPMAIATVTARRMRSIAPTVSLRRNGPRK